MVCGEVYYQVTLLYIYDSFFYEMFKAFKTTRLANKIFYIL